MFSPLAQYLSRSLDREVILETAKDFEAFWKNVSLQRYDIVHYNQYHYVRSHKEQGYNAILKNEEFGSDTISGSLFVREDSGINKIEDLRGKKVIFGGGPTAMMSYIVPTYILRKAGLQDSDYMGDFAVSPPNAIFATYYGHADAGGSGSVSLEIPTVKEKIDAARLKPLAASQPLPHLVWAVKADISDVLKKRIQKNLEELKGNKDGKAILQSAGLTGLNIAIDEDYDEHRRIAFAVLGEDYCDSGCESEIISTNVSNKNAALTMGIFPRRTPKLTIKMFQPVADWLSKELGRPIRLVTEKDFKEFWRGVKENRYDIVHFNQYHYVKSHKLYGYNVILKNEEKSKTTLTPTLWVRKDSGINQVSDLKGKKIIFGGGKMAMLAYIGPTYLLRESGLVKGDYEEILAINPLDGCKAMYLGQADACGAGTILIHLPSVKKIINAEDVKHLETAVPLTHLAWAVKGNMDPGLRSSIQSLMSGLGKTKTGKELLKSAAMTDLHAANDTEYDVHRGMIRKVTGESY
jgi:phosphonate transport system substrate-binding protein